MSKKTSTDFEILTRLQTKLNILNNKARFSEYVAWVLMTLIIRQSKMRVKNGMVSKKDYDATVKLLVSAIADGMFDLSTNRWEFLDYKKDLFR